MYAVRLWNVTTRQPTLLPKVIPEAVQAWRLARMAWPASSSSDKTIRLWDVKTGQPKATLEGHTSWVTHVAFSPDGLLAFGGYDKTVQLWDVETGAALGPPWKGPPIP